MSDHPVPAFTVRYDGTREDEGVYASAAAARAGVEHHEIRVPYGELAELLADTTWHMDEPIAFQASPDQLPSAATPASTSASCSPGIG